MRRIGHPTSVVLAAALLAASAATASATGHPQHPGGSEGQPAASTSPTADPLLPGAEPVAPEVDVVPFSTATGTGADSSDPSTTGDGRWLVTADADTPQEVSIVGVTWDRPGDGGTVSVQLRSRTDGQWSPWEAVEVADDLSTEDNPEAAHAQVGTEPMAVIGTEQVQVRAALPGGAPVPNARLSVWDPGTSAADDDATASAATAPTSRPGAAAAPAIHSRADWGADESLRTWRPKLGEVRGVVVHHTAGSNGYSRDQVPGIIRGIYAYHARTLGWGDIGYNVLVDRFGRAWEGRYGGLHRAVIAGHASEYNKYTFGISVLGDYQAVAIPDVALGAVARVSGWKLEQHGVPADGTFQAFGRTHDVVLGHQEVSSTLCPGRYFQPRLGEVEQLATDYQSDFVPGTTRLSGKSRYETAVAASRASFAPNVDALFIASGLDFPDALAGGPAAAHLDAPLLLVRPGSVPGPVAAEIERLKPRRVYILGGPTVVDEQVHDQLAQLTGKPVSRLLGGDRYRTAAQVASLWDSSDTVFLASGEAFADALSGGPAAASLDAPMLLTRPNGLPGPTGAQLQRLAPSRVVILGGELAIGPDVEADVRVLLPNAELTRHAGGNRYDTSARISAAYWPGGSAQTLFARADDYPDALAGTPYGATHQAPILVTRRTCQPAATAAEARRLDSTTKVLLGGPTALVDNVATTIC